MPSHSDTKSSSSSSSSLVRDVVSGSVGAIASTLVVHPLDTVRTRLQTTTAQRFTGAWHCARSTLRLEGVGALYKVQHYTMHECIMRYTPHT